MEQTYTPDTQNEKHTSPQCSSRQLTFLPGASNPKFSSADQSLKRELKTHTHTLLYSDHSHDYRQEGSMTAEVSLYTST